MKVVQSSRPVTAVDRPLIVLVSLVFSLFVFSVFFLLFLYLRRLSAAEIMFPLGPVDPISRANIDSSAGRWVHHTHAPAEASYDCPRF